MSRIYIDIDGTLLDGSLDSKFAASNFDTVWYDNNYEAGLAVNHELVAKIIALKEAGNELILWTNRSLNNRAMTQDNLGDLWNLFTERQFWAGKKLGTNVDGFTFDNEAKYLNNNGQLISW